MHLHRNSKSTIISGDGVLLLPYPYGPFDLLFVDFGLKIYYFFIWIDHIVKLCVVVIFLCPCQEDIQFRFGMVQILHTCSRHKCYG